MKEKTKKFIKDNWKIIVLGSIYAGVVVAGALAGRKLYHSINNSNNLGKTMRMRNTIPFDSTIYKILVDAHEKYPGKHLTYGGTFSVPYTADQLGELGVRLKSFNNYDPNDSYTHFIVIGEEKK